VARRRGGNWELAAYQIAAQTLVPTYRALPVKQMVDDTITTLAGPIAELEKAVDAKDFGKFSADFDKLTEA